MKAQDVSHCEVCPRNTYSPDYGSIECMKCPIGTITEQQGANHIDYCRGMYPSIIPVTRTRTSSN